MVPESELEEGISKRSRKRGLQEYIIMLLLHG